MIRKNINWIYTVTIGVIIIIFSTLFRLFRLTLLPVFADEAIYIRWSQIMANEPTLRFLPLSDGKQPLFMWILMFFVDKLSDPLFAGRLLSVGSGIISLIGIFVLSFILFRSKKISLLTSLVYVFSPYTFFFDRMALVDSLLSSLGIWVVVFAILTAKTKRLDMAMLTGFALGFASLTKSPAIFFVLLIPLSWVFADWKMNIKNNLKNLITLSFLLLSTFVIAFMMYNLQRLGPNFHMLSSRTADYVFPISHLWTNPKDPLFPHFDRAIEWLRMMGPWPVLILALLGLFTNLKKYWKEEMFLFLCWFVPTFIQSEFAKVFTARYELFTIPFMFVIAASVFLNKNLILRVIAGVLACLFMVFSLKFNYLLLSNVEAAPLPRSERSGYLEEWTAGTGIKEVADYLKLEIQTHPDQKIVVGTEGYFGTLPDGLQMYMQGTKNVTVIGVGLDFGEVPEQLQTSVKSGTKTYLVANSSRIKDELEKNFSAKGLKIVKTFKKANRPEMYKEKVLYGEYDTFYLLEVMPVASTRE